MKKYLINEELKNNILKIIEQGVHPNSSWVAVGMVREELLKLKPIKEDSSNIPEQRTIVPTPDLPKEESDTVIVDIPKKEVVV
jgi:hypothetical protein